MTKSYLTKEDIDQNVLVSDVLIGLRCIFHDQIDNVRNFVMFPDGKDKPYNIGFVNMERNEWYCTNPDMEGKATDLLEKVFDRKIDDDLLDTTYRLVGRFSQCPKPSTYMFDTTDTVQVPMDVSVIDDDDLLVPLYLMGISQLIANKYMKQGSYIGINDGEMYHTLLFPNSNGGYYSMVDKGWRVVGEEGVSLIGSKKDCQRLCVFDSPLDFLALQQKRHIKGADVFFSTDRFLIINGKKNLDEALGHVATHPEYYHVCCFFPNTDQGREMFAKFRDICQGTAVNSSRLYTAHTSIADSVVYDVNARRMDGLMTMTNIIADAKDREFEAKLAAEQQAQAQAAKQQMEQAQAAKQQKSQAPVAEKQQPKVQNVPQTTTVRDTQKPKSESTQTTQKVTTDDVKPKRSPRR